MSTKITLRDSTKNYTKLKTYVSADIYVKSAFTASITCKEQRNINIKVRPLWPSQ